MSTSDNIRDLARKGFATATIAQRLGIRYQHAYNVLKTSGIHITPPNGASKTNSPASQQKPPLLVNDLTSGGFILSSQWILSTTNELELNRELPKGVGVYAFVKNGIALYVGVATMGLSKRLYFYKKPGASQRTNLRINDNIKDILQTTPAIDIYTAEPPDLEWNDLPVHGSAGLELGLIKKYALPWNMRSIE